MTVAAPLDLLPAELVRLRASPRDKAQAIRDVARLLAEAGRVDSGYADSMERREAVANTFLDHGVAIPHGLGEDRHLVRADGIAVLQVPGGVEWNPGQTARLIVGVAAQSDNHLTILRRLTRLLSDEAKLDTLIHAQDAAPIIAALTTDAPIDRQETVDGDLPERADWTMAYPAGLHARPASVWADAAKAAGAPIRVRYGAAVADARNLVALLQLGIAHGEIVTISTGGSAARATLQRFLAVANGLIAQERAGAVRAAAAPRPARGWAPPGTARSIDAIGASPGLAIGHVHIVATGGPIVTDTPVPLGDGARLLEAAIARARLEMETLIADTTARLGASDAAIFRAQAQLLDDTDLLALTCRLMVAGHGVAWAWNEAANRMAEKLGQVGSPVLAARSADLRDIGRRVLAQIDPAFARPTIGFDGKQPGILIAADLSPSDTASIDVSAVAGLAMASGGPTSHTAILARTLGLPAVVAAGAALMTARDGAIAIVDGDAGRIYLDPSDEQLASARMWSAQLDRQRAAREAARALPACTRDGHRVSIGANVNRSDQVSTAVAHGAEGVGLMRTEFLFLERGDTPGEDEQFECYRGMIDALEGRPLIVRALDIGGDKQVAHLDLPHEENPFLGMRGARLLLRRPDLMVPQLRALYRAAKGGGDLSIMFPMVTSLAETVALKSRCEDIRAELDAPAVPIGIMVEVPAAALLAGVLAEHVDFFSIGTNDLTQYTLAIDRQNAELAPEADSLHPAVLRLIDQTVRGARRHDRWVGVCGGMAGDPFGASLLTGLGVTELSMTPRDVPAVKARLRASRLDTLEALAARGLECDGADAVRALDPGEA